MKDYLAAHFAKPRDMKQAGVKGMRWGVRRDRATLRAAAKKRAAEKPEAKKAEEPRQVVGAASGETSAARYSRLAAEAKSGKAGEMSEQDLKFFNARTDALAKINKLNQQDPSWLKSTATKVLQQTAQTQMQNVADSLATKYIGDPIKASLKGQDPVKTLDQRAKEAAASKIDAEMLSKRTSELVDLYKKSKSSDAATEAVETAAKTAAAATKTVSTAAKVVETASKAVDPTKMRYAEALQYYKDNPSASPVPPEGYSRQATKNFLAELKRQRES